MIYTLFIFFSKALSFPVFAQDAYALCRVFKKSTTCMKVGERCSTMNSTMSQRSDDLYLESRCDDVESTDNYSVSLNTYSPSIMNEPSAFDEYPPHEAKWVQPLHEDTFQFPTPSFSNHGTLSYPPSQVMLIVLFSFWFTSYSSEFLYCIF